jgi:hypothetical protein
MRDCERICRTLSTTRVSTPSPPVENSTIYDGCGIAKHEAEAARR